MARVNLIETIYEDLRRRILTEELHSGQKISETALAESYNCSRTPIRETLKRLEDDGLVVIRPKSGTYVKNETQRDFVELMQVRAALERMAFILAVAHASEKEIKVVEKLKAELDLVVSEPQINMVRFAKIHYDFHLAVVRASGNDLLIRQFERLNLRSSHMFFQMMDHGMAQSTQDEHQRIVADLRNRDTAGGEFIQDHLLAKIQRYLGKAMTEDLVGVG